MFSLDVVDTDIIAIILLSCMRNFSRCFVNLVFFGSILYLARHSLQRSSWRMSRDQRLRPVVIDLVCFDIHVYSLQRAYMSLILVFTNSLSI